MIGIKLDETLLRRKFTRLEKSELPFATALGLTWTARDAKLGVEGNLPIRFSGPTPYTRKSVLMLPARRDRLESFVYFKDEAPKGTPPVKYLAPGVYGGKRRAKRFERALQRAGLMDAGELAVPARDYPLNSYGNIPGGTYSKILRHVKANPDPGQNITESRRSRRARARSQFFISRGDGNLPRGVYERLKDGGQTRVRGVLMYVSAAEVDYEKRFDFFGIVRGVVQRTVKNNFITALRYAIKNPRGR